MARLVVLAIHGIGETRRGFSQQLEKHLRHAVGKRVSTERPKGYRLPKIVISYVVYLYHRFLLSYRDVQELLFERGIDVSHKTVRVWCAKFGPDLAEALRHRKPR